MFDKLFNMELRLFKTNAADKMVPTLWALLAIFVVAILIDDVRADGSAG